MELRFRNNKIKEQCENPQRARLDFGSRMGNVLTLRVTELAAATSLLDIKSIPYAKGIFPDYIFVLIVIFLYEFPVIYVGN
jgi:hypothetical protein